MKDTLIQAVIFDLGGVLIDVDSSRGIRSLAARIPDQSEKEILAWFTESEASLAYELGLLTDEAFYHESIRTFGDRYSFEEFSLAWVDIFSPIQSMIDLLPSLAARIPICLLSNTNRMHIDYLIRHFSFFNLFRKAYYSYEIHLRKPEPAIFAHVIQDSHLNPAECLFIDDKRENVQAAFECGFRACVYEGGTRIKCAPDFRTEICLTKLIENGLYHESVTFR